MNRRTGIAGAAVLLLSAQAALTNRLKRAEYLPSPRPIHENIPVTIGQWDRVEDGVLDPEAYAMLAPDDVLNRTYRNATTGSDLNLFLGYYKTQLRAKNAHDPKVCLPGSGWNPLVSKQVPVTMVGLSKPISVNYYLLTKNNQQALVLYWFQTHRHGYASTEFLRLSRVISNLFENRSDMALVRIVLPVDSKGLEVATSLATKFAGELYPALVRQFPHSDSPID
jgi:EpsI family protein